MIEEGLTQLNLFRWAPLFNAMSLIEIQDFAAGSRSGSGVFQI
jgi:hypothetical protein